MILASSPAVALALIALVAPQQTEAPKAPVVIQVSTAGPVTVKSLSLPWGPNTFMAMESPGESFYNKRTWAFAQMETTAPLTLYGATIPAGNYALVFHPNTTENKGMSLEIRRIAVASFLEPGNVMTRTPEGETVWKAPIRFQTSTDVAPALKVDVSGPTNGKLSLVVRYGSRTLAREFGLGS
jgi:hypothetical protein